MEMNYIYYLNTCFDISHKVREKVKQSHYRPGHALRVPGG
jgi:hypothetical protein